VQCGESAGTGSPMAPGLDGDALDRGGHAPQRLTSDARMGLSESAAEFFPANTSHDDTELAVPGDVEYRVDDCARSNRKRT
jgi:hypothetical protein